VSIAPAAIAAVVKVMVDDVATPTRDAEGDPADSEAANVAVALAGATDVSTPKPNAATATSATRLIVVFVDICFLSISRSREFPSFGFELIS
jgi:hypothetical protein